MASDSTPANTSVPAASQPAVHSEAWPAELPQQAHSNVHEIFQRKVAELDKSKIEYRLLDQGDIAEVRNLHLEWFPLRYGDDYYNEIGKYNYGVAIGAFYKAKGHKSKILLGAILTRVQHDDSVSDIIHDRGCCYRFARMFNCWHVPPLILYIMTIGVIDEARRFGIGGELLDRAVNEARSRYPACEGISLHVVAYNHSAISFYKKKGYRELARFQEYYTINEKRYDALFFGLLFSETKDRLKEH